ncbi:HEAT repeat domain-containing protein [Streptomyces rubradiris]|nr:HEAT repeat domain-containing protein [Streptomyces rubradiris]
MINVNDVDWRAGHLPGQVCGVPGHLTKMLSEDPAVRAEGLEDFYAEAHDQGAVDPCTAASVPLLFAMADNPATPDRGEIVKLLLSIGRESLDRDPETSYFTVRGVESTAHVDIVAEMTERAEAFARYAADTDPLVRRPAIAAVGLFLTDGRRAARVLAERLPAAEGIVERLLVVRTMARLAERLPATGPTVTAWLDDLLDGPPRPYADAPVRLSALTHRFPLAPDRADSAVVPRAIALLREITATPAAGKPCDGCRWCETSSRGRGRSVAPTVRPVHLAADFFDPEHPWEEHSPVSSVLRALHTALGDRIAERADLLVAQLTSPDAATRYDALAMAEDIPGPLPRPVLTHLLALLPDDWAAARMIKRGFSAWLRGRFTVAAEDTALLLDTLADHMATLRDIHGPDVWATDNPLVRSAYQEAVMILADHHDPRALPDIIRALETRVDEWRVLHDIDGYPQAADRLVPLLADGLRRIDPHRPDSPVPAGLYLSGLAGLKDSSAIPVITDTLTWANRHRNWTVVTSALNALAAFGPIAQAAHTLIRPLANAPDNTVRTAARTALDALTDGKHPLPTPSTPSDGYGQHPPH